ncbi:hypothetical protein CcrSwift_gp281 [Caulobacter phage CcrSwift]|uniref:Uncharacterized protein n=1 Tax=Caulobacter phage CcrSwift TaxID=2927984 RepID=K4JTB2_9CAUD|nr:hypothetical protein D870_gp140 [Caulobacter phage CcrSwift]AFU88599.1 hypothetical protein CcrSwift_gp281 [Caulobacter phage CcrSwift]
MTEISCTTPVPNNPRYVIVTVDGRKYRFSAAERRRRGDVVINYVLGSRKGKWGQSTDWVSLPQGPKRRTVVSSAAEFLASSPDIPAEEQSVWAGVAFANLAQ